MFTTTPFTVSLLWANTDTGAANASITASIPVKKIFFAIYSSLAIKFYRLRHHVLVTGTFFNQYPQPCFSPI
jgi:hypothetical protein